MKLSELNNPQLVTLAVAHLGGDTRLIDSEDIAIEVGKFALKRFCWKKYPDLIDLHAVRQALIDAKRLTPSLVTGGLKDGWMLSPEGLRWVSSLPEDLGDQEGTKRHSVLAAKEAEKARLYRTTAFAKYHENNAEMITLNDLYEFVRINEYFPDRKRRERFTVIENATLGDPELQPLWVFLKDKFQKEIISDES